MKLLRKLRNYMCYCGIEKDEYKELKKDAYVSNFEVWRVLHCFMAVVFAALFLSSGSVDIMAEDRWFYLVGFIYSAIVAVLFLFVFKKDSIIPQFVIYLSISLLFVFSALITQNNPNSPAASFIVFLLITPMFMIDKPYFMAIELIAASAVFLVWMHGVKPYDIWKMDFVNISVYAVVGIVLHITANSIRIREFVLKRELSIQKDTDDLTGLWNKGALTRAINGYLGNESENNGILFVIDIDRFKVVNDTYGHDVGDSVISQFGAFLKKSFGEDDIIGRFGGDEFIVFMRGTDDTDAARSVADRITSDVSGSIALPDEELKISVSVGIAVYKGDERNYSELFKKADVALYEAKADKNRKYRFYGETVSADV